MRYYFDTEFIEDGKTIDLISIGMVRENGETLYRVSSEFDETKASDWVKDNVLIHIVNEPRFTRQQIAADIAEFTSYVAPMPAHVDQGYEWWAEIFEPEFWAWYADYDWVSLCQLYGTMMDLPKHFPMYCRDLKQYVDELDFEPTLPEQRTTKHHALNDALWVQEASWWVDVEIEANNRW